MTESPSNSPNQDLGSETDLRSLTAYLSKRIQKVEAENEALAERNRLATELLQEYLYDGMEDFLNYFKLWSYFNPSVSDIFDLASNELTKIPTPPEEESDE